MYLYVIVAAMNCDAQIRLGKPCSATGNAHAFWNGIRPIFPGIHLSRMRHKPNMNTCCLAEAGDFSQHHANTLMLFLALMLNKVIRINHRAPTTKPKNSLLDTINNRVNGTKPTVLGFQENKMIVDKPYSVRHFLLAHSGGHTLKKRLARNFLAELANVELRRVLEAAHRELPLFFLR